MYFGVVQRVKGFLCTAVLALLIARKTNTSVATYTYTQASYSGPQHKQKENKTSVGVPIELAEGAKLSKVYAARKLETRKH